MKLRASHNPMLVHENKNVADTFPPSVANRHARSPAFPAQLVLGQPFMAGFSVRGEILLRGVHAPSRCQA